MKDFALLLERLAFTPARAADEPVKIGILSDIAGPSGDLAGQGSVLAAQMVAAE